MHDTQDPLKLFSASADLSEKIAELQKELNLNSPGEVIALALSLIEISMGRELEISDAKKSTEVLLALSVESRKEVDETVNKAIKAGGIESREAQEHGWMYSRSFEDINGHIWEVFHMDLNKMPEEMKKKK